ncbi:hypothetical protein ACOSP7_010109 [Xanthoceras sorbifolium]
MNFIFEVHLRRTTNPLGSRSNPEGSKIEPLWVRSRTQRGSKIEPLWVRDRTQRVRSSNPEGSIFEPSGFHEPRGFVLRTLWVPRTQKGSYLRTLLGSRSNPEGSFFEPSGFHEPRRVRIFEPFWVRDRTQRVRSSNPLGSTNPEGSFFEPRRARSSNPEGFDLRTLLGSRSNPGGFDLRTLWVRSRTQRVRGSSKMNFEDEVHLRRTKMNFKIKFFFFFLVEIQSGSPPLIL